MIIPEKFKRFLRSNFHFISLLLFFTLHGWNDFFVLIGVTGIVKILSLLIFFSIAYFFTALHFIRNKQRAALFTTFSFFLFLFYEAIEKFIFSMAITTSGVIPKLIVGLLIAAGFLFFLVVKKEHRKVVVYGNLLLTLLVVLELGLLISNSFASQPESKSFFPDFENRSVTDSVKLPPVYFIVLDEYAGAESLKTQIAYDNTDFLKRLEDEQGFRVLKDTKSNYGNTVPSMASVLNGKYIEFPKSKNVYNNNNNLYRVGLYEIYHNEVVQTFIKLGYKIENYSPFSIKGAPYGYRNRFLPVDINLILSSTIFDDVLDLTPLFIARRLKKKNWISKLIKYKINDNFLAMEDVLQKSLKRDTIPTFCYLHLMMPHSPFAVDSLGNTNVDFFTREKIRQKDKNEAYLQYLVYTNGVISEFLKKLKLNTGGEAVIMLMSDHGSRDLAYGGKKNESFNNLNAIYYPAKKSTGWFDGMSNVNQFRVLFSEITGVKMQLLKDSIAF